MNEHPASTKGTSNKIFTALAMLYLAAPNLLFLATWVNPWIGLPCVLMVSFCCVSLFKSLGIGSTDKLDRKTTIFVFSLALFWTAISGAGGLFPQFQGEDYIKHNLLFDDLVRKEWPVVYDTERGKKFFLCYSFGYHLVPAFVARCLGDGWLSVATFLWTLLGISLFFFWVANFNRQAPARTLVLFLFFAGLGIVWLGIRNLGWREPLVQLGLNFNYPDWWTKLAFSPQHLMPAWLGTALLYDRVWLNRNSGGALLIWAMTLLWSPFTPLGLLLVLFLALPGLGTKSFLESKNLLGGGILLVVMGIYYKAHLTIDDRGWIWSQATDANWFVFYLLYICVQIFPASYSVFLIDRKYGVLRDLKPLFLGAFLLLILFPLYKMGYYSDLRQQASGPLLVFLSLSVAGCLTSEHFSVRKPLFLALFVVYCIGAFYPLARPIHCLVAKKQDYSMHYIRQSTGMADLSQLRGGGFDYSTQYMGTTDSLAYKYLLKH